MKIPHRRQRIRTVLVFAAASCAILVQAACARSVDEDFAPVETFAPTTPMQPLACVETQCPAPFATCGGSGPCTVNLTNDVQNCGACDNACPKPTWRDHASSLCSAGQCRIACDAFFADCNQQIADGCEVSTYADPQNCGGCGLACKTDELCWKGACGCPSGFTQCGNDCVKLDSDNANCGACGTECKAPADDADPRWICGPKVEPVNTKWQCGSAACTLQCKPGFGDCNNQFCGDGCEIDLLHDAQNCGTCGNACANGQWCNEGTCSCPSGTTRCGTDCVDLQVDPLHCGSCAGECPGPSSTRPGRPSSGGPACEGGQCKYVCNPGYADCDGDVDNGCEADLATSQKHCGACGTSCNIAAGQPCVLGKCLTKECEKAPGPR